MAGDDEEVAVAEEVLRPRLSKMTLAVIVLSVALGVALLSMLAGGVFYARKTGALQVEVTAVRKELNEKAQAYDALQDQVVALSRQLGLLKAYAVSSSPPVTPHGEANVPGSPGETKETPNEKPGDKGAVAKEEMKASKAEGKVGAVKPGAPEPVPVVKPESAGATVPPPAAKAKRVAPEGISCDLTGKSADEQAAILKHCVSVMDAPPPKSKASAK